MRSSTFFPWAMPWMMIIFFWLLISAVGFSQQGYMLLGGYALGPDSYVRLVRVEELLSSFDWYQTRIADLGYPAGADIHWTRPLDLLILLVAAPLMIFMSTGKAVFWAGAVISALSLLAATLSFIWAIRPVLPKEASADAPGDANGDIWLLPASALMAQPVIFNYGLVGRADHHMTLVVLFILAAGFLLRALTDKAQAKDALFCGIAMGVGLWVSVELLMALLPVAAAFALVWMRRTGSASQAFEFSKGLTATVGVAVVLENPPGSIWAVAYDRISVVHFTLAAGMLVFWWIVNARDAPMKSSARALALASAAIVGGTLMQGLFPAFFAGPMAELDASASAVWVANVVEMRSLLPTSTHAAAELIMILGNGLFAVPYCLWRALGAVGNGERNVWQVCALLLAVSVPVAVLHVRFALYAETVFLIVIAAAWARAQTGALQRDGSLRVVLMRAGAAAAILIGATAIGGGFILAQKKGAQPNAAQLAAGAAGCDLKETGAYLDSKLAAPLTMLTHVDHGPALVYHSRQRVLAGPYHRDGEAIIAVRNLLAGSDLDALHISVAEKDIDMILLCGTASEAGFFAKDLAEDPAADTSDTLFEMLMAGRPPSWLRAVELPESLGSGAKVFAVSDAAWAALAARD